MATPDERFDPRDVLDALERNYVAYVLIGGLAQVLRGADRVTRGVDICPSLRPENLLRLETASTELEARRTDRRPFAPSVEPLESEPVIALSTRSGPLNVIAFPAGAPEGYDNLRRAASKEPLGRGLAPHVASTGDLARLAGALEREHDRARLPRLRRILELEADRGRTLGRAGDRSRELDRDLGLER